MNLFRAIPIDVHAALEVAAAPAADGGALRAWLRLPGGRPEHRARHPADRPRHLGLRRRQRGTVPLSAHAGLDYILAAATIAAGFVAGIAGDYVATVFLVGFGSAHMALTASTRFSRPLGA